MSTLKHFLASLFAVAGWLSRSDSNVDNLDTLCELSIETGRHFVRAWGERSRHSLPRPNHLPRPLSPNPPPVEKADRPTPPSVAPHRDWPRK